MFKSILTAFGFILFAAPGLTVAQTPTPTCSSEEKSHQFDFWIGDWEVTAGGQVAGHNHIVPILDGCVIQENWTGASGSAGTSLNFYNPPEDRWEQFWVWRNGSVIHTKGHLVDGKMILQGTTKDQKGNDTLNRITWSKEEGGAVRQYWEISSDGGETWTVGFDGLYTKR